MFHSLRSARVAIVFLIVAIAFAIPAAAQTPYFVKQTSFGYEGWPRDVVDVNGIGYFAASSSTNFSNGQSDEELWRTDGTPAGTFLVKDIRPGAWSSGRATAPRPVHRC